MSEVVSEVSDLVAARTAWNHPRHNRHHPDSSFSVVPLGNIDTDIDSADPHVDQRGRRKRGL